MTAWFDHEAEACVVGACLVRPAENGTVASIITSGDFGSGNLAATFDAMCRLHSAGAPVDAKTVVEELRSAGQLWDGAEADLIGWMNDVPAPSNAGRYAEMVARRAERRRLYCLGSELVAQAADPTVDPADAADSLRARLAELDSPVLARSPGDLSFDEFVAQPDDTAPPVIPGLLAQGDRAIVVAPEGLGKSELLRQLATLPAHGLHPFTFKPILPVPVLLVDLENPPALLRRRLRAVGGLAALQGTADRAPATLWPQPGGIDLRKRTHRSAFEDVLRRHRPRLVVIGPVYKMYSRRANESDEQVAAEVQAILDDLRVRYGFALVLEHHAPQANGGTRDLRPFGSSLWLRWPEYGLKLVPDPDNTQTLRVGRWRGDRDPTARWPDELRRGAVWPWEPRWKDGAP